MYGYIYLTTNLVNGRKYIGQHAKSEFDKSYYGSGTALITALDKYGKENFTCEVLDWAEDKEELNQKEIDWIAKCDAVNSDEYYNIAYGGDVGIKLFGENNPNFGNKWSEEQKLFMSKMKRGKYYGENNPNFGNKWSEDKRKEASELMKGRFVGKNNPNFGNHLSEEQKRKISEANRGRHLTEEAKSKISEAMKGRAFSEEWKRKLSEANKGKLAGENNQRCKPVVQLTISGELIQQFKYVKQSEQFGFKVQSIIPCCKGRKEFYKGYKWMYLEDYEKMIGGEANEA